MATTASATSSSLQIAEGAVVCDGAILSGDIIIGPETVVFPSARIQCLEGAGPIVIGRGCVVEEGASIISMDADGISIGNGNLFEVGCTVCAQQIGDFNVFQPKSMVGRDVIVSSGCAVGPTVVLDLPVTLSSTSSLFRTGGEPDEYKLKRITRNLEMNRSRVKSYRSALSHQGKKYYIGKYNRVLPHTTTAANLSRSAT